MMLLRMKNVKLLMFYTSPLQNHNFWVHMEAKMEPQWRPELVFVSKENDIGNAMPFRTLSETFLQLKATAEERWVPSWGLGVDLGYI